MPEHSSTNHTAASAPITTIATPATTNAGRRLPARRGRRSVRAARRVAGEPFSLVFSLVAVMATSPAGGRAAGDYSWVMSTCISPMRTLAVDCRVTVSEPEAPPPVHVTSHVVVAVTGNASLGCPAEDCS